MRRTACSLCHRSYRGSKLLRSFSTTVYHHTSWSPGPSPPRLSKDEQDIYEQLQKQSTGAFSTPSQPSTTPQIDHSPQPNTTTQLESRPSESLKVNVPKGEELHPNIRRGAPPEFEGDINPKTGEVGGPKNEPLRWGHTSDWSYNGRATDF